eukprot:12463509-Alexandrium_andersonii.AAC.1
MCTRSHPQRHPPPVRAASSSCSQIDWELYNRLNPQSAMRKTHEHVKRSKLELRGTGRHLKTGPQNSRW